MRYAAIIVFPILILMEWILNKRMHSFDAKTDVGFCYAFEALIEIDFNAEPNLWISSVETESHQKNALASRESKPKISSIMNFVYKNRTLCSHTLRKWCQAQTPIFSNPVSALHFNSNGGSVRTKQIRGGALIKFEPIKATNESSFPKFGATSYEPEGKR